MGQKYHDKQANSEVILWIYIKKVNSKFGNPRVKSPRVEATIRDKLVIKNTWQNPVDNCDKGIRKRDRDCGKFAFHQCSANSKLSKKGVDESNRNVWNVTTDSSSAIDLDSKNVSTDFLNRLNGSFF